MTEISMAQIGLQTRPELYELFNSDGYCRLGSGGKFLIIAKDTPIQKNISIKQITRMEG